MSEASVERRTFWAYVRELNGEPLPSTIRERAGDSESALKKTDCKYRGRQVRLARVVVEWKSPNADCGDSPKETSTEGEN